MTVIMTILLPTISPHSIPSPNPVFEVSGRVLPLPRLEWGEDRTSLPDNKSSWSRDFSENHFLSSIHLRPLEWFLLFTDDCKNAAETLKRKIIEFAPRMVSLGGLDRELVRVRQIWILSAIYTFRNLLLSDPMSRTTMRPNEWMNEWMNEWVNEWMNEWTTNGFSWAESVADRRTDPLIEMPKRI